MQYLEDRHIYKTVMALRAGSNHPFKGLGLHWRSLDSGGRWYKSRKLWPDSGLGFHFKRFEFLKLFALRSGPLQRATLEDFVRIP